MRALSTLAERCELLGPLGPEAISDLDAGSLDALAARDLAARTEQGAWRVTAGGFALLASGWRPGDGLRRFTQPVVPVPVPVAGYAQRVSLPVTSPEGRWWCAYEDGTVWPCDIISIGVFGVSLTPLRPAPDAGQRRVVPLARVYDNAFDHPRVIGNPRA